MNINNYECKKKEIQSPEELLLFLKLLLQDRQINGKEWVNSTLDGYLESIIAWCEDSSFLNDNDANWKEKMWSCIAELFHAGKHYE